MDDMDRLLPIRREGRSAERIGGETGTVRPPEPRFLRGLPLFRFDEAHKLFDGEGLQQYCEAIEFAKL
jgi:hypothetical protein